MGGWRSAVTMRQPSGVDDGEEWLEYYPHFDMNNVTAVQCIQRHGLARLSPLLALPEDIFTEASQRFLTLSAEYVPGHSIQYFGTAQWSGNSLSLLYSLPQVDLFVSLDSDQVPLSSLSTRGH